MLIVFAVMAIRCTAEQIGKLTAPPPEEPKPEIVCWGDSLTAGYGASKAVISTGDYTYDASGKSYPEILGDLTGYPVYNFGVTGARSDEIAYMQGAIPSEELEINQHPEHFFFSGSTDDLEQEDPYGIGVTGYSNTNGYGSAGTGGASGTNSIDTYITTADNKAGVSAFIGIDGTDTVIFHESPIDPSLMATAKGHLGDVLVLEIGSNGGWEYDYDILISQYRKMIEHAGCDKYIIIGDTDDPGTSIGDVYQAAFEDGEGPGETAWEAALSKAFGDHFINMRVNLIENGLSVAGLTPTDEDEELASRGCVSTQLRTDWTHLNSYGYYAQAKAVYDRGVELGYWS